MEEPTTELRNIEIDTKMMDARQVSSFTERTYERKGTLVHLSGDRHIGTLSLSGSLLYDSSVVYGNGSVALGNYCQAGALGFRIVNIDKPNQKISCESKYIPDEAAGLQYSLQTTGAADRAGTVSSILKINENTYELSLSKWHFKLDAYSEAILYFPDMPGIGNVTIGDGAYAEGLSSQAFEQCAHAEGYCTEAGKMGHAEGRYTRASWAAHAEGDTCGAMTVAAHAGGRFSDATGYYSFAQGLAVSASSSTAIALGVKSDAKDQTSFVWNGESYVGGDKRYPYDYTKNVKQYYDSLSKYESHGAGSFNVNPLSGTGGFFIGNDSLCSILENIVKNSLKGKTYYKNTNLSDIVPDIISALGGKYLNENRPA